MGCIVLPDIIYYDASEVNGRNAVCEVSACGCGGATICCCPSGSWAVVLSGVGCVTEARVRDASGVTVRHIAEPCEIVSLNGTVSAARCHLHIALAREDLSTLGGHLMEGTIINTTCELVLLEPDGWRCGVEQDDETGYDEIVFQEEP